MNASNFYGKNRCISLPVDSDVSSRESDSDEDVSLLEPSKFLFNCAALELSVRLVCFFVCVT